jgi:hypothetical protein
MVNNSHHILEKCHESASNYYFMNRSRPLCRLQIAIDF